MQQDYVRLNQLKRHPARRAAQPAGRRAHHLGRSRGKNLVGMGAGTDRAAAHRAARRGVPVLLNTALTDLYVEDGVVRGVYVRDMTGPKLPSRNSSGPAAA